MAAVSTPLVNTKLLVCEPWRLSVLLYTKRPWTMTAGLNVEEEDWVQSQGDSSKSTFKRQADESGNSLSVQSAREEHLLFLPFAIVYQIPSLLHTKGVESSI
ncbi:hypothetical protein AAC387_Pa06g0083 [Persea americana]